MGFTLLGVTLAIAVTDWMAVAKNWRGVENLAKPLVMIVLLGWMWAYAGIQGVLVWFALGIVFSMIGDIFLLPGINRLIPGLVSFLLAHMAYIIGFNLLSPPPLGLPTIILAALILVYGFFFFRRLYQSLAARRLYFLRFPLLLYATVITLMLLSALTAPLRSEWEQGPAYLVIAGAGLFFISDTILAWNRFVKRFRYARLLTMVTYHLGQIALIAGAAQNFKL